MRNVLIVLVLMLGLSGGAGGLAGALLLLFGIYCIRRALQLDPSQRRRRR